MIITIENIIDFLDDEGIGNPRKTKIYDELDWKIMINEPWENDTKMRCGIISKNENGKCIYTGKSTSERAYFARAY